MQRPRLHLIRVGVRVTSLTFSVPNYADGAFSLGFQYAKRTSHERGDLGTYAPRKVRTQVLESGPTRDPVLILTGAQLLTWQQPPQCWNEQLQERFQNVHSLLAHGNASQQIYLGLPSWQQDWHAAFERRRRASEKRSKGPSAA